MESLVEFEYIGEGNRVAIARLVREKPLNSLLLETIDQLAEKVYAWLADENIACIVLDSSSERAFCAGADITALYHSIKEVDGGENPYAQTFFLNEYRLDYALHTATKPIVAWGNGIVMGGGLGLLGGCSHRIGTPRTRIAMPEITIGLFPDAGGTKFLSDMPDHLGFFAGLTGCQLSAGDALALDLLDVVVEQENKAAIFAELSAISWSDNDESNGQLVTRLLEPFRTTDDLPLNLMSRAETVSGLVNSCLEATEFFQVFDSAGPFDDEWLDGAMATYRGGSATTARVFVEQMKRARGMSLQEMFAMELTIAYQCIRHADFPEGVRALLVDKDKNPKWTYESAAEIPDVIVDEHFQPSWQGEHPLQEM